MQKPYRRLWYGKHVFYCVNDSLDKSKQTFIFSLMPHIPKTLWYPLHKISSCFVPNLINVAMTLYSDLFFTEWIVACSKTWYKKSWRRKLQRGFFTVLEIEGMQYHILDVDLGGSNGWNWSVPHGTVSLRGVVPIVMRWWKGRIVLSH